MIKLKYYTALLLILLMAASCRKVIDLKLGDHTGQLVIEGNLTDDVGKQYITISRNVPFTSPNTYPPVTGATVILNNNHGNRYPLTEESPGKYVLDNAFGTTGRTYTLEVTVDGTTYKADSTMPPIVALDSIASKGNYLGSKNDKRLVTVFFADPKDQVNQYRFLLFVNSVQVKTVFAFNDDFINGKYVNLDLQENDIDIFPKDTVKVEMQCIDKPVYQYWFTLSQQQGNNPGGAVAPANPPTNFNPATLGYFSAHTTQSITLVVE